MNIIKKCFLAPFLVLSCYSLHAQIDVGHISTKEFSSTALGVFLNFSFPATEGNSVTAEIGGYSFKDHDNNIIVLPILLGYRYSLDGSGTGFYLEPAVGYTFGASDITKYSKEGYPMYDDAGNSVEVKTKGITAGVSGGYMLPGKLPFSLSLRYLFVKTPDPSLHILSLRLAYNITFGRRESYY
jgi:hypothetical protein